MKKRGDIIIVQCDNAKKLLYSKYKYIHSIEALSKHK